MQAGNTLSLFRQPGHPPYDSAMLMFVFRLTGSYLHQLRFQRVDGAQESLDTLDLSGSPVRRFHRAVSEMLLHPEEINPAFGYRKANHHVLAWYLAQFPGCETWHENIRSQLHLITRRKRSDVSAQKLTAETGAEKKLQLKLL